MIYHNTPVASLLLMCSNDYASYFCILHYLFNSVYQITKTNYSKCLEIIKISQSHVFFTK